MKWHWVSKMACQKNFLEKLQSLAAVRSFYVNQELGLNVLELKSWVAHHFMLCTALLSSFLGVKSGAESLNGLTPNF